MKRFWKKHIYLKYFIISTPLFILILFLIKSPEVGIEVPLISGTFLSAIFSFLFFGAEDSSKKQKHKLNNHRHHWEHYTGRYVEDGRIFFLCKHCKAIIEMRPSKKDVLGIGYWTNRHGKTICKNEEPKKIKLYFYKKEK